jgi:dienelactone hydrolase
MLRLRGLGGRKGSLVALTLGIGVFGCLVRSARTQAQDFQCARKPFSQKALAQLDPMQGYTIEEGKVADDRAQAGKNDKGPHVPGVDALDLRKAYERSARLAAQTKGKVFKETLTPHWFANNTRFWYRNDLKDGTKEFIVVDAHKGTRGPAFDHEKLAAALSKAAGKEHEAKRLPFDSIEFVESPSAVLFTVGDTSWRCDLSSYECAPAPRGPAREEPNQDPLGGDAANDAGSSGADSQAPEDSVQGEPLQEPQQKFGKKGFQKKGTLGPPPATREARSPDGRWTAFIKDNNVYLRAPDGKETQATAQGAAGNAFTALTWSPDSRTLVAYRTEPGDNKEVYMVETSPREQLPAKLHVRPYPRPGDKFTLHEMWLVNVPAQQGEKTRQDKVDIERLSGPGLPRLRWAKDSQRFTFENAERSRQRYRIVEVNVGTGKTRNIIDEVSETFIWTVHPPRTGLPGLAVRYLEKTGDILLVSQRAGWKHLYLVDGGDGTIKARITQGPWVVRSVDRVDEEQRQIWFRASGKNPDQDPYLMHHYRVNFDGSGLVALTQANGDHSIQFSPDRSYLIDTYSRVDMPPAHELRRVSDGTLVCKLEQADVSALEATGWKPPEVFVAKGRDGRTDIWGIVYRPQNYDPKKKYPVIELIYAGPHDSHVPKRFTPRLQAAGLAELGFIVVQIDGMGTANRSRAFHDVCWKNLADAGFPDRILWMKELAKKYDSVDISRVGIFGTSAGGQSALGALLFHPEFYKVAVAACGCHDNRLDKWSWNEQWMGLMGPHYEQQSNVTNAHKLQGKLLLIVGELDTNVPYESTMRVVDALIRARKDFDLLFVPGMGHSSGGAYGERRRLDFFVRHLHGLEPPDRNADEARAKFGVEEE